MGLFKKLFRRKKTVEEVPSSPTSPSANNASGKSKTSSSSLRNHNKSNAAAATTTTKDSDRVVVRQSLQLQPVRSSGVGRTATTSATTRSGDGGAAPIGRSASFTPTNVTSRDSNSSRERDIEAMGIASPTAQQSQSEHIRMLSPRNGLGGGGPPTSTPSGIMSNSAKYQMNAATTGAVRHDENLNHSHSSAGSSLSPRLSHQQLQQFDLQNNGISPPNGASAGGAGGGASGQQQQQSSMYTMSADVPRDQMQAMDDMNRSDASSSSFNLSTDAEDSEYETLRRRGVIPRSSNRSKLDSSHSISAISGVASYTTADGEERLFPGLHDDLTLSTSQSGTESMAALQRLGMSTMPYPNHQNQSQHRDPYQGTPTPNDTEPGRIMHRYPQQSPPSKQPPKQQSQPQQIQQPQQKNPSSNRFNLNNNDNDDGDADDDIRAWNISPSTASNNDPNSTQSLGSQNHRQMFNFDRGNNSLNLKGGGPQDDGLTPRSSGPVDPPASTTSRSSAGAAAAPRNSFASPKSRASSSGSGFSPDPDFATFVDFNAFGTNAFASLNNHNNTNKTKENTPAWREEKKTPELAPPPIARQPMPRDFSEFDQGGLAVAAGSSPRELSLSSSAASPPQQYAHSSPGGPDTSLSELLAQAKNKQRRGGGGSSSRGGNRSSSGRASSSSVNSAPAITASFLRQHHNLGKYSTSTSGSNSGADRSYTEGTSVSDIISSLEATNQTRMKNGSRVSYGHRSVGDAGAVATARAVKERLREKRRMEREFGLQNNGNRSTEESSSDNSDNEASESWLFDEVTGALGPRGIAADLESLSGRSNRSKNSQGNKSHRSHRSKSRRSRPGGSSSSRRHHHTGKSSGDSVDSRGSRTSRNSRYSHRSTKSFISQMSEQSRSVANDLLRLEMQLAMVGGAGGGAGNDIRDDLSARMGGGSVSGSTSLGGGSRMSRSGGRKASTSHNRSSPSHASQVVAATASSAISHATRRTKVNVLAPPGKLGIILANKADSKGTVVSGVRTSSVLVDQISPGDRIVAIDGEDVSRMTVSEITTIMSRKADYDRTLTVLTIPKQIEPLVGSGGGGGPSGEGLSSPQHHQQQQQYHPQYNQYPSAGGTHTSSSSGMMSPSQMGAARSPASNNGGGQSSSFDNGFPNYRR